MRSIALVVVSLSLLASASCGGGGGGGGGGAVTVNLPSSAALDGFVSQTGIVDTTGAADVGDFDFFDPAALMPVPVGLRGYWSFDLSAIPAGATITSATFTVNQLSVTGDPYSNHGAVLVDHVDYGPTLDAADYNTLPFGTALTPLSSDATVGAKGPVDVTALVAADLAAARTRTQLRGRFSTTDSDNDSVADHADFATADSVMGNPVLTVTYIP